QEILQEIEALLASVRDLPPRAELAVEKLLNVVEALSTDKQSLATTDGVVSNSIIWDNGAMPADSGLLATYSCVEGGSTGGGNINTPPLLDATSHLTAASPCIDSADASLPADPDGSPADMGALPYDLVMPSAYCEANKLHSGGCFAQLNAIGNVMSLSGDNNLELSLTDSLPQVPTWVFWSTSSATVPFLGGTLCLGPPLVRGPATFSDSGAGSCSGTLISGLGAETFLQAGIAANTPLFAQAFFRDGAAVDGTGAGLTNAVEFLVLP
ncbi:MAG: hypothetical protein ACI8X5_003513, partial [Planctomycetota bacterium]